MDGREHIILKYQISGPVVVEAILDGHSPLLVTVSFVVFFFLKIRLISCTLINHLDSTN